MKNIIVINYIAIIYSIIVGVISYIFFKEYSTWAILGAMTALFNYSLMVRFTKNTVTKELMYLLIAFRTFMYLIILGFMFFYLRTDTNLLMYSYLFFLIGAVNTKIGVFIFHLPIPAFVKMRADEIKDKEDDQDESLSQ